VVCKVQIPTGVHVSAWCYACDAAADPRRTWLPKGAFDVSALPWRESPTFDSDRFAPCAVCGAFTVLELHHLAPREFFGDKADRWPVVEVCRSCHEEWHLLMGRPIGRVQPNPARIST
jgi:hypothetical protein